MIDTSAMIGALVASHEFHELARPHIRGRVRVPAVVLAETYAQLRRTFGQRAEVARQMLAPWSSAPSILPTTAAVMAATLARAVELDLGGNVHDAVVAQTCVNHDVPLVTLDRRQHRLALAMGCDSTYLGPA